MSNQLPLENKTFVFTGNMQMNRQSAQSKVTLLGGRSTTAISHKTTHLIVGNDPGPSKLKKAKEFQLSVLNESEFIELIKNSEKLMDTKIHAEENAYDSIEKIEINISEESEEWGINKTAQKNQPIKNLQWSEKYRPRTRDELVGNPGAIKQLEEFLDNPNKTAAVISGSPGLGKTTVVEVLCREKNIICIEFNASDIRNKKALIKEVRTRIGTESLSRRKRVIVMDEVDGMTSDRGGIAELVQIIKKSKVPFICICNNRTHPKMRTLLSICEEIKFRKPVSSSILPRLKSILKTEGKFLPDPVLNEIIIICNQDLRFILNTVQKNRDLEDIKELSIDAKNISKNTFEEVAEMFKVESANKKMELYFSDYQMMPLFVFEHYLKNSGTNLYGRGKPLDLNYLAKASNSISFSDVVDQRIHGTSQEYSLLPIHAVFSCLIPAAVPKNARIDFPSLLGNLSKLNASQRIIFNLSLKSKLKGDLNSFRLFSSEIISKVFAYKMINNDIKGTVDFLIGIGISNEDVYDLLKIVDPSVIKKIPGKAKGSLTREYKKRNPTAVNINRGKMNEISSEDFIY
ncbi:hypothetical protein NUSPORA_00281 [Nucleospora cyclopteri]